MAVSITRLNLCESNAYLINGGKRPVLVDCGAAWSQWLLGCKLQRCGVDVRQGGLLVLTHAHADHMGNAAWLQEQGWEVLMHAADVPAAERGNYGALQPATCLGWWLKRRAEQTRAQPFCPRHRIDGPLCMAQLGMRDVVIQPTPGHTPGSLSVLVDKRQVIGGDLLMGGCLGFGCWWLPAKMPFIDSWPASVSSLAQLLQNGMQWLHVGHGGPLQRAAVERCLARWR